MFPFNKEIHALAVYEKDLPFEIVGYYDIRQSGRVTKTVSEVLPHASDNNRRIQNVCDIPWEGDFDTIICGHCDEIRDLTQQDLQSDILNMAQKYHKRVYSFDAVDVPEDLQFYSPVISEKDVPECRFGRLRERLTPMLGVFGTSSCQGKLTFQMEMRKRFIKDGYNVAHISTEPNGYLLGCDSVYPIGYHAACRVRDVHAIQLLNEMLWEISDFDEKDVMIVGGQSGAVNYDYNQLAHYNLMQHELICAVNPDVVALCVNVYDDIEYIKRTISYFYSFNGQNVAALILYPIGISANQLGYGIRRKKMSKEKLNLIKRDLLTELQVPVFILGDADEMDKAYSTVLDAML